MPDLRTSLERVAKSLDLKIEHERGPFVWKGQPFSLHPTPPKDKLELFFRRCKRLEKRARMRSALRLLEKERQLLAGLLHRTACQSLTVLQLQCDLLLDGEAAIEIAPLLQKLNLDFRKVYDFLSSAKKDAQWLVDEFGLTGLHRFPPLLRRALLDYLMAARSRQENLSVTKTKRRILLDFGPQVSRHRQALEFLEVELVALGTQIDQQGQQIHLQLPAARKPKAATAIAD